MSPDVDSLRFVAIWRQYHGTANAPSHSCDDGRLGPGSQNRGRRFQEPRVGELPEVRAEVQRRQRHERAVEVPALQGDEQQVAGFASLVASHAHHHPFPRGNSCAGRDFSFYGIIFEAGHTGRTTMSRKIKNLFSRIQASPRTGPRSRDRIDAFYGSQSIIRLITSSS